MVKLFNLDADFSYFVSTGIFMEALSSNLALITLEQITKLSQNWTTQLGSAAKSHQNSPSSSSHSFLSLAQGILVCFKYFELWGFSSCSAGPGVFPNKGSLLFSGGSLTSVLPGQVCLGNVTNVELISTPCSQRSF